MSDLPDSVDFSGPLGSPKSVGLPRVLGSSDDSPKSLDSTRSANLPKLPNTTARKEFFLDAGRVNLSIEGQALYPRMHSERAFAERFGKLLRLEYCLYILPSLGLGYGLSYLLHNSLPNGSLLVIFEDDVLCNPQEYAQSESAQGLESAEQQGESAHRHQIAQHRPPHPQEINTAIIEQQAQWKNTKLSLESRSDIVFCPHRNLRERLKWIEELFSFAMHAAKHASEAHTSANHTEASSAGLLQQQRKTIIRQIRRSKTIRFTNAGISPELQDYAQACIQQQWQNHSTRIFMAHLWIQNTLRNTLHSPRFSPNAKRSPQNNPNTQIHPNYIYTPLASLSACVSEHIVLCGAGTGLDEALPQLREAQSAGATIATVDTALPSLTQGGIIPHIVFVLDGQLYNVEDFIASSAYRSLENSLLVYDISAQPAILRLFRRRAPYSSQFSHIGLFSALPQDIERIPALGSIGPTSLYILAKYTKFSIYYCGFDFAFPRGQSHARSSSVHQLYLRRSHRLSPLSHWALESDKNIQTAMRGNPALSNAVMQSNAAQFGRVIQNWGQNRVFPLADMSNKPFPLTETGTTAPIDQEIADERATMTFPQNSRSARHNLRIPNERSDPPLIPQSSILETVQDLCAMISYIQQFLGVYNGNRGEANKDAHKKADTHSDPKASTEAEVGTKPPRPNIDSIWNSLQTLAHKHSFLWEFLPQVQEPNRSSSFLIPLEKNIRFWLRYLQKRLYSSKQSIGATGTKHG